MGNWIRTARLTAAAAAVLVLAACGTDSTASAPQPSGIAVSGVSDLTTAIPLDPADICTLTDYGDHTELTFQTNPAVSAAASLTIDIKTFSGKAGQVYSDLKGPAAAQGTIVTVTASNDRAWAGGTGSVTVDSINGTLATGSVSAILNPQSTNASGGLNVDGHWECIPRVVRPAASPSS